jgi:hypothetical protein
MEEDVVHIPGVSLAIAVQFLRYREYDVEVRAGQQVAHTLFDPAFAVGRLTLGAMSVPARIVRYPVVTAVLASVDVAAIVRRAAAFYRPKHLLMPTQGAILFPKGSAVLLQYVCQLMLWQHIILSEGI